MKECLKMELLMVMGYVGIVMVLYSKVSSKEARKMGKEFIFQLMGQLLKECGKTEKGMEEGS